MGVECRHDVQPAQTATSCLHFTHKHVHVGNGIVRVLDTSMIFAIILMRSCTCLPRQWPAVHEVVDLVGVKQLAERVDEIHALLSARLHVHQNQQRRHVLWYAVRLRTHSSTYDDVHAHAVRTHLSQVSFIHNNGRRNKISAGVTAYYNMYYFTKTPPLNYVLKLHNFYEALWRSDWWRSYR